MQEESEESMEYDDEALISYFHVLELLATEFYASLKKEIKKKVLEFLNDIYDNTLHFSGDYLKDTVTNKATFNEQLIFEGLPVAGKVLYALHNLGINSKRQNYFLKNVIKDRNNVAHGRIVYQDKIIFPVPQFFPTAKIKDYTLDGLKSLTAHAICKFAGTDIWLEEWQLQDSHLIPTPEEIKEFVAEKKYKGLSNADFANGVEGRINPGAIAWYMVDKKYSNIEGLEILKDFIRNIEEDKDQITQVVMAIALITDVAEGELLLQCENILNIACKNNWHLFTNMREVLVFLEYNGLAPKRLVEMIEAGTLR